MEYKSEGSSGPSSGKFWTLGCSSADYSGPPSLTLEATAESSRPSGGGLPLQNLQQHIRHLQSRDWKLSHSDSGQSSLEYWDYSVELEMLKGPEGKKIFLANCSHFWAGSNELFYLVFMMVAIECCSFLTKTFFFFALFLKDC